MTSDLKKYGKIAPEIASQNITETRRSMGVVQSSVSDFLDELDPRIKEYDHWAFGPLTADKDELSESDIIIKDSGNRFQNTYNSYRAANNATSDIVARTQQQIQGMGVSVGPSTPSINGPIAKEELAIDKTEWEKTPPAMQEVIREKLKDHGLTEDDINRFITGKVTVDKYTFEQIESELTEAIKHSPAAVVKLEKVLGFSIMDDNGKIDPNRLKLAMMTAGKNLGMDVDLTPGTPFRKEIDNLSNSLENAYSRDPSIRDRINSTYGVDVYDINGKVDKEKLALVRVIDGIDKDDGYDINKMIPANPNGGGGGGGSSTKDDPTPIDNDVDPDDGKTDGPEVIVKGDDDDLVTPTIEEKDVETTADKLKTSVKDGFGSVGNGILDAIEKGASRIARGISPYSGNIGGTGHMNKATAGIIAAASVAAGGVTAGGGLLVSKKLNVVHFGPEDWDALGADYQTIIEALMRKVGFSSDDFETFKLSHFKIYGSELRTHARKIEQALDSNPTCDDELLKLYNYSMFDDNNKVIDYLLFITMIIDGRNTVDEYNMYNVINQSIERVDDADFLYSGIAMEDYFDDSEDLDIKIVNDPITAKDEEETEEPEEEQEEKEDKKDKSEENFDEEEISNPQLDKEWLRGIGIDD